ncbi:uncharacterized protein [Aristolochia californica]|uniref:uncharacterized protein isoform X2 n=1 Tax=Aristolochia californica TaxID=171875 RepID=UPI0035E0BA9A
MESNARDARKRRLAERGADRLAFITGQRDAFTQSLSLPKAPVHVSATVSSTGEDDTPSPSVAPKAEIDNDTVWKPTGSNTGIHLHHRTSSLPVQPSYSLSEAARTEVTDGNPTDPIPVLQNSQSYSGNLSNKSRLGSYLAKTFSPNRLSLSISATETIRLVSAVIFALIVAMTSQTTTDPLVLQSFLTSQPLVLLLLTNITIVLGLILVEKGGSEMTEEGKTTAQEDDWADNVGKVLEVGLMMQKALNAVFMDFSVYAVMLISGLSLRYYFL